MSSLPRRKIGSRACDGCKIRKVRCSEQPPCTRCSAIGIECTFNKRQATRGPRSLRAKTLAEIRSIQESHGHIPPGPGSTGSAGSSPPEATTDAPGQPSLVEHGPDGSNINNNSSSSSSSSDPDRTPVSSLIVRLCIYRLRLFPVWPILAAEDVIGGLLRSPADMETYALANAVSAAIIAQLKLPFEGRTDDNDPATAASMAAECQKAKALLQNGDDGPAMNLNTLRIAFFQHIYHENLKPGGSKSLLFLREAITIAQIMGLHRISSYGSLPADEQQMRRRILWLLFVTERGVAMLHKLPTILTWQPSFPALDRASSEQDEAHILPAFKKLVDLFWMFDQGGAFDLIHADDSADLQRSSRLEFLQNRLQDMSSDSQDSSEVQQADILVTRSWMQAVLWRASIRRTRTAMMVEHTGLLSQPYRIVNDFLSNISHYSKTALEAHGPTIELKIFEIASALTDALSTNLDLLQSSVGMSARPVDMLIQLQRLLASSRGGNKTLLTLLCARIAEVESAGSPELVASPPSIPGGEVAEARAAGEDVEDGNLETVHRGGRRMPDSSSYMDTARLGYPLQIPVWPGTRQDPNNTVNVDPGGNLGTMFSQLTNDSWNGWALDFSGMSQITL